ncbi:hypothetical protein [Sorangium sp. So ce1153]|uniref:hypothetical protein n=1 Tax=Sorangium sp. So ce1153 TaxID=3133333 RepID=UPI003F621095
MKKMALMAAVFVTACGAIDDNTSSGEDGISQVGTDVGDDGIPADSVGLVSEEPVGEAQQALKLTCDDVCGVVDVGVQAAPMVAAGCLAFGAWGPLACGLGGFAACKLACAPDVGRRCVKHGKNGKACVNRTNFWWCDNQVDGNRVRVWYELRNKPGLVKTVWAPSNGCWFVGYPRIQNMKRFEVCTEREGCSGWANPTGAVASASVFDDEQMPDISLTPLWRYWNDSALDHYYTVTRNDFGYATFGYGFEKSEGSIFRNAETGTVPIYQYWNETIGDHFFTTNWSELGGGAINYSYEGVTGHILPQQYAGTVPIHRYWSDSAGDHYYTKDYYPSGFCYGHCYVYEGVLGYVYP